MGGCALAVSAVIEEHIGRLEYAALWEDKGALDRLGYSREDVENELWPWLKQQGLVGDDGELLRFLDKFLQGQVHLRPGLRLRRIWAPAEAARLGPALAPNSSTAAIPRSATPANPTTPTNHPQANAT